eukprot:jgi/Mesen1/7181/ME000037S06545
MASLARIVRAKVRRVLHLSKLKNPAFCAYSPAVRDISFPSTHSYGFEKRSQAIRVLHNAHQRCSIGGKGLMQIPTCQVDSRTMSTAAGTGHSQPGPQSNTSEGGPEEERSDCAKDERLQVLEAALPHVMRLGWSQAALEEAARDLQLSPAIVGIFQRREAELYFMDECLKKLHAELALQRDELAHMTSTDRMVHAARTRLEMQALYTATWPQALNVQAMPSNLAASLRQRADLIDAILDASSGVGDGGGGGGGGGGVGGYGGAAGASSDAAARLGRKLLVGSAYGSAELYMLTDFSPGFEDTWLFLRRQIESVMELKKTAREASQAATAIGQGIANTLGSFLRGQVPGQR